MDAAEVTIPNHELGDIWPGIPSITFTTLPSGAGNASTADLVIKKVETVGVLRTLETPTEIVINNAATWDFTIAETTLPEIKVPGDYQAVFSVTDANSEVRTPLVFFFTVPNRS